MKNIFNLILLVMAPSFMVACVTVKDSTRISSPVKGLQFNDVLSRYAERPTFVSIGTLSNGSEIMAVEITPYERLDPVLKTVPARRITSFLKTEISSHIRMFDKFEKWRRKAIARGDSITKVLGRVKAMNGELEFRFHSGNSVHHYLSIAFCALGNCVDHRAITYDYKNVKHLKKLLQNWRDGKFTHLNEDEVYK